MYSYYLVGIIQTLLTRGLFKGSSPYFSKCIIPSGNIVPNIKFKAHTKIEVQKAILSICHTSLEGVLQQKKRTWNATYLGSFGTHSGFISYILENKKTSLFGVGSQYAQPIRPKFGGFFCLCTTGPPKRLVFLFSNMYEMKPEWVPNDPR